MSYEVKDEVCEIDLSKLISFSMSFQPLQLFFQSIFQRVKQAEADNERQDGEIDELKKALEELRQRDAERDAQLQELLRQQQEAKKKQKELGGAEQQEALQGEGTQETGGQEEEGMGAGDVHAGERVGEPVDLRPLWDEVENIKRLMGEFWRSDRRPTIEQLYEARKRQEGRVSSSSVTRRQRHSSLSVGAEPLGESEPTMGDAILDRAKEELVIGEDLYTPWDQGSGMPLAEATQPPPREEEQPERGASGQSLSGKSSSHEGQKRETGGETTPPFDQGSGKGKPASSRATTPVQKAGSEGVFGEGPRYSSRLTSLTGLQRDQPPMFDVPVSINDRLRRDAEDIAHLNRVVAEMLNEMKGLHDDMDFMRTINAGGGGTDAPPSTDSQEARERSTLPRRVEALEEAVKHLQGQANLPTGDSSALAGVGTSVKDPNAALNDRISSMMDNLRRLKDRLDAMDQVQERMDNKLESALGAMSASGGDTGVSPARLAMTDAAVKTLEKQLAQLQGLGLRNCEADLAALQQAVAKLQEETAALEKACALLDEKKEDKGGRRPLSAGGKGEKGKKEQVSSPLHSSPLTSTADLTDLSRHLEDIQQRVTHAEGNIKELDEEKADRAALQRINDDMRQLRQLVEFGMGKRSDDGDASAVAAMQAELLQKLQQQLSDHVQNFNKARDGTTNELDALRAYMEQIDHCKADAKLVANKAERDYVENALERLMREVEQVLNATNAGLIDTLDKSLNVLRDLLDGKATKNEMDHLRRLMSEDHVGSGAPDALLGFRGFRCLGCNRAVETMRPRNMGNRLQPFVNRLPQNHPDDPVAARIHQGPSGGGDTVATLLRNN